MLDPPAMGERSDCHEELQSLLLFMLLTEYCYPHSLQGKYVFVDFKAFCVTTLFTCVISGWFQKQLQTKDNFILLLSFERMGRNKKDVCLFT